MSRKTDELRAYMNLVRLLADRLVPADACGRHQAESRIADRIHDAIAEALGDPDPFGTYPELRHLRSATQSKDQAIAEPFDLNKYRIPPYTLPTLPSAEEERAVIDEIVKASRAKQRQPDPCDLGGRPRPAKEK